MKSPRRPQNLDLLIPQKTSKAYELQFLINGGAEDISSFTVYFTAKSNFNDADASAVIDKKITSHTDAAEGKALIELSESDTNLTAGNYRYSISYIDDDGYAEVIFTGRLIIEKVILQTRY